MNMVVIHTRHMRNEQKKRIEEALIAALHKEGFPAGQAVLHFELESSAHPSEGGPAGAVDHPDPATQISPEFKTRARRTNAELQALKTQIVEAMKTHGTLTSFQARKLLGLTECNWAPPALRRLFGELEDEGLVVQRGVKRNTCYVWQGSDEHDH
ncbi:hypothetical protein [Holophaga foetida]|uniref:hypothetical protein n=1 Tax=Holophaga foetida TaxID=35839 RepID=UPI0002472165|nr:hypothetical protein [Holophaga foetida]